MWHGAGMHSRGSTGTCSGNSISASAGTHARAGGASRRAGHCKECGRGLLVWGVLIHHASRSTRRRASLLQLRGPRRLGARLCIMLCRELQPLLCFLPRLAFSAGRRYTYRCRELCLELHARLCVSISVVVGGGLIGAELRKLFSQDSGNGAGLRLLSLQVQGALQDGRGGGRRRGGKGREARQGCSSHKTLACGFSSSWSSLFWRLWASCASNCTMALSATRR